jgi:hypothetical protein
MFFDQIDAIGGARFDDGAGGDNEVYRTMLELSFDPRRKYQGRNEFPTLFIFCCVYIKCFFCFRP